MNMMRLLGGILLIVGTAVGGGLLALPIATAQIGFFYSTLLLFGCWFVMTASAFLILEVNLWLPRNNNLVSMAKATLGLPGQVVTWITNLLLFYSLLAAYIAGGTDFLRNLLTNADIHIASPVASILFTIILGSVVYWGIRTIDYVNRGLMIVKFTSYFLLVILILPHISATNLSGGELPYITGSITVALTSFGFATIVPSLRVYFHDDKSKLRLAIMIGSLIPLICYILWNLVIMGMISRNGDNGLIAILHSGRSTSEFVEQLHVLLQNNTITYIARLFTSICLATSFLGVSLGLSDFIADGFGVERHGWKNLFVIVVTFLPPLVIALYYPGAFVKALSYAGIYVAILMVLMPALMVWQGRYRKKIANGYQVMGGKVLLIALIVASIIVVGQSVVSMF